jgi:hypothetical protein
LTAAGDLVRDTRLEETFSLEDTEFLFEDGDSGTPFLDTNARLVEAGDSVRAFLDEYARLAEGDGRVDAFSSSLDALDDRFMSVFSAFAEFPFEWRLEDRFAAFFFLEDRFFAKVPACSILYSTSSSLATSKVLDSSTSSSLLMVADVRFVEAGDSGRDFLDTDARLAD